MLIKRLHAPAILAATALCVACSSAPAQKPSPAALRQCIAREAQTHTFSGVVSITLPNGDVVSAHGVIAGAGSAQMLPDAQFSIGSAGKMWTAVAIAQLVDRNKIGLDDTIGQYVRGLTPEAAAVTIRQLLTHSSGLGNFFTPEHMDLFMRARSLGELKQLIASDKPAFAPGSKSKYSNSGFLLLGLLIEQVSGQPYADYLQTNIFEPAGMTGSSVLPAAAARRAIGMTNIPAIDPALSGTPPGNAPETLPPPGPLRPAIEAELMGTSAGGSYSTPSDMQRFFAALLASKLTSAEMLKTLTSRQFELLPAKGPLPAIHYGLGFMVGAHNGHAWIGHGGGAPGLNVATAAFGADQVTIVVMSNRDPPAADLMLRAIQTMLFEGTCRA
jgi:D-alanyl-D-alanine carboxypeptidase